MLEAKSEKPEICVFSDKYKYGRTNMCKKCATKKAPELGALRRFVIGGGDGDANNG